MPKYSLFTVTENFIILFLTHNLLASSTSAKQIHMLQTKYLVIVIVITSYFPWVELFNDDNDIETYSMR